MARLSIGEFAQASGLTPKALRLYDELGLLPPAHVDPRSGYRSYDPSQLARAKLVLWLRGLGMPLARIRVVCDLPPLAAAAEVSSYWRQVEADTAARRELATFLVDHLSRRDTAMADLSPKLELLSALRNERGLVREKNEDAAYQGRHLFAVADGFGTTGPEPGVSVAAIDALAPLDTEAPAGNVLKALGDAVLGARTAVREIVTSDPAYANAGTTLTAMLWSGTQVGFAHVGDSRAYLLRGGDLTRVTHDHTVVQSLVDEGKLTPEEAVSHPQRARLLRALHADGSAESDLHLREAHVGDRYLLCSDGLHAVIPEQQIHQVLDTASDPQEAVDRFTQLTYDAGAPDNIACVVVDALAAS
ncbi:protein phosphatase [Streptoalloteichus tenebrarius]|uniref:Protein phosphatase n=1 Tax=Streptoalloteichus tenebrarius (strain ATCC 17920 / DSM 40477 / JCM 4838 / CBS 697.72 / NBRC 16177 / NCIMB 11028 / NRRL B-12390 / A12253. 1 / ISP 5477) TaxID=1933 RepID=A0ABT1HM75_STRSD|nr:MerR family transcriptional regulator [Streptoalloteichus tenebrarius]MCP2256603.1 protein phosphatase [Streptoalloteichus tenebrarius]BFF04956.1 MerR family transcriptional regulator [Streptoalloteichus tenebrarius]